MEGKKVVLHSILLPPSFILLSCTLGTINMAKFAQVGGEKKRALHEIFLFLFLDFFVLISYIFVQIPLAEIR